MSYQKLSGGRCSSTLQWKKIHSPLNSALFWPLGPSQELGMVGSCKHPWSSESEGVPSLHWLCDRLYASGPIAYWKASPGLCWPSKFRSASWLIFPGTRTIKGKEWICLTCPLSETLIFEPNPKQRISCLTYRNREGAGMQKSFLWGLFGSPQGCTAFPGGKRKAAQWTSDVCLAARRSEVTSGWAEDGQPCPAGCLQASHWPSLSLFPH